MKKVLLFFLVFCWCYNYCQPVINKSYGCAVQVPANYIQWRNSVISIQNLVTTLQHDTCLNKKFSVAFHIVMDSTYRGNVPPADLATCITNLNNAFKRICVQFQNCFVDSIPNYSYNYWIKPSTDAIVTPAWDKDSTINIYLTDSIKGFPAGYAYFPGGKDVIVIEKSSITAIVPIHEMGHFFGLVHTFDEIGTNTGTVVPPPNNPQIASYEWFRRTNCYDHGDGFCDTEADCYPSGYNALTPLPCHNVPGSKDGYNDFYVPPVDNYMTYFTCSCRFTQEQYNFMARVILTKRLYLH